MKIRRIYHHYHAAEIALSDARRLIWNRLRDPGAPLLEALDVVSAHLARLGAALEELDAGTPRGSAPDPCTSGILPDTQGAGLQAPEDPHP